MRQREREILIQYFYNRSEFLDAEYIELKNAIRFRNISEYDLMEMVITHANRVMLRQINNDIFNLLKIWGDGNEND